MIRNTKRIIELKISEDGSSTLYVPELEEHYHSTKGAYTESMHVFIQSGLKYTLKSPLCILEIGFGTGLNAYLTAIHKGERNIFYHGLEKYPLESELINQLQFEGFDDTATKEVFDKMNRLRWNEKEEWLQGISLLKEEVDINEVSLVDNFYDLVYFDAFAPDKQPEMWEREVFAKIHKAMKSQGVLTTYCAKGEVRRTLMACGFVVERIPGPPGKRQMMRAIKP